MLYPALNEFKALCAKGNLIPVYREILADMDTPVTAFLKLGGTPSFLLESVVGGEKWARYSFIGSRPSKVIMAWGRRVEIREEGKPPMVFDSDDPLEVLKKEVSRYVPVEVRGIPRFFGGLVGYMGYDMVRFFEKIPDRSREGLGLPDMFFMLTDTMLIFDSLQQKIKVVSNAHIEGKKPDEAYHEAEDKIREIIERLNQTSVTVPPPAVAGRAQGVREGKKRMNGSFTSSFGTREAFKEAVSKAKEFVMAGDVVQVVLSQRFERELSVDPFNVYRALRVINPSPYMYYLDTGEARIVGSSPEILARLEGKTVVLRPIAGTRRRGETESEDKELEEELKKDPKEIAEHIMLVDLGRNDVGRVARTGSVKVTELMSVERYSHVMHLVSHVEGELREGLDAFDVLRATFPAGTVSGAPKVMSMEIIEELEPTRRGPYAGAVGYFSYSGNMDTCITIRTLIIKDQKVYVQSGAGIVADSDPEGEYGETVNKAIAMMKAVDMAEKDFE
ncbi:MAG TPA: anthranilate synthase component I [Thermodesulfovibrionales bacterium]|nr:anthranilate synthase component I [Thermodesulfovibrionales bacterium]